jgi:hypothetical protein
MSYLGYFLNVYFLSICKAKEKSPVTPKWQERLASHQEFLSRKDEDQGE